MSKTFFERAQELSAKGQPFVVATVVRITGSSSAKPGAKAIINSDGQVIFGWVGGGCAESLVASNALESLHDGEPRIVEVDLNDEVLGAGMPCGGSMEVYVEPFRRAPHLLVVGHGRIAETLAQLGRLLDFRVTIDDPAATEAKFAGCQIITQDPDFSRMEVTPETYVVIATQHKSDHLSTKRALDGGARYIGLIASEKRSRLVFQYLLEQGIPESMLSQICAPAGLDIGAKTPEEIALSIMSEIISVERGGTGSPMVGSLSWQAQPAR